MVEPPGVADVFHGPDGTEGTAGPGHDERRHEPDRGEILVPAHDLHGRIEDKRQAIERERREFMRRSLDGSNHGH